MVDVVRILLFASFAIFTQLTGTSGLVMVHIILFAAVNLVSEPRKRGRLLESFDNELNEFKIQLEMELLSGIKSNIDSLKSELFSHLESPGSAAQDLPVSGVADRIRDLFIRATRIADAFLRNILAFFRDQTKYWVSKSAR